MTARKLDKSQWRTFFDRLSKTLEGKQAEIEVASLSLGDQVEAEWLPLHGITYDPNDDLVEALGALATEQRRLIEQLFWEDCTETEVADAMGTNQSTINRRKQASFKVFI